MNHFSSTIILCSVIMTNSRSFFPRLLFSLLSRFLVFFLLALFFGSLMRMNYQTWMPLNLSRSFNLRRYWHFLEEILSKKPIFFAKERILFTLKKINTWMNIIPYYYIIMLLHFDVNIYICSPLFLHHATYII